MFIVKFLQKNSVTSAVFLVLSLISFVILPLTGKDDFYPFFRWNHFKKLGWISKPSAVSVYKIHISPPEFVSPVRYKPMQKARATAKSMIKELRLDSQDREEIQKQVRSYLRKNKEVLSVGILVIYRSIFPIRSETVFKLEFDNSGKFSFLRHGSGK